MKSLETYKENKTMFKVPYRGHFKIHTFIFGCLLVNASIGKNPLLMSFCPLAAQPIFTFFLNALI